jgi:hypothetical protein
MDKSTAIALLQQHRRDLQQEGLRHLAVFGSVARGEQQVDSDLDLLATLDPNHDLTLLDVVRLERRIAEILQAPVHITVEPVQKPRLREAIAKESVCAF